MAEIDFDGVTKIFGVGPPAVDHLSLHVDDGEFMVLVGPSGCGKTTALRMLAGLEEITSGTLKIGNAVVNNVLPKDRDVAMVFQNYALYPHMSVAENIGFALKIRGDSKSEIKRKVAEAASILHLSEYLERRPKALSGGQRQRVAMGRAIVRSPQHDQVEAMTMGDRVAVLRDGQLQQVDTPQDLYDHPVNEFVAGFMGSPPMNLVRCRVRAGNDRIEVDFGDQTIELPWHYTSSHELPASGLDVVVGIRPEDVIITDASSPNTIQTRVERREALGAEILVHLSHVDPNTDPSAYAENARADISRKASLVAKMGPRVKITVGDVLSVQLSPEHAHFFDAATGVTLRKRSR